MNREVYLDNAATTRPYLEAIQAAMPYATSHWGNPSSSYSFGMEARTAIERARQTIADTLGAEPEEIFFTSGATEANNTVISAVGRWGVITTPIEHHAILRPAESLGELIILPVDKNGRVDVEDVNKAIKRCPYAPLVSVMAANNEIGTVEPINEIANLCQDYGVLFHTDATQYYGHQILNVNHIRANFISASAHKFGGLKGTGFLYIRGGVTEKLEPFIKGGLQERGFRAGTENVFGIVAMGKAAEISCANASKEAVRLIELRSYLTTRILNEIDDCFLTGDPIYRLPNNASFVFGGIRGEELVELLGMYGIFCSSGSACETGSDEPSHVLKAIGLSNEEANGSLRLTLGKDTTKKDLEYVVEKLKKAVEMLRSKES